MRIKFALEGSLIEHMKAEVAAIKRAVPAAVTRAARGLQQDLRAQTRSAGLGNRVANAWRLKIYENHRAVGTAGFVYSNAPDIISAFRRGTPIRAKSGRWLAIPTPQAPKRGRDGKRISPANFPEEQLGKLRFVFRRGKPGLLVVDNARVSRTGRARANVTRRRRDGATFSRLQGRTTVVMFVLVPQVRLGKRLSVSKVAELWRRCLPQILAEEIDRAVAQQGRG